MTHFAAWLRGTYECRLSAARCNVETIVNDRQNGEPQRLRVEDRRAGRTHKSPRECRSVCVCVQSGCVVRTAAAAAGRQPLNPKAPPQRAGSDSVEYGAGRWSENARTRLVV